LLFGACYNKLRTLERSGACCSKLAAASSELRRAPELSKLLSGACCNASSGAYCSELAAASFELRRGPELVATQAPQAPERSGACCNASSGGLRVPSGAALPAQLHSELGIALQALVAQLHSKLGATL